MEGEGFLDEYTHALHTMQRYKTKLDTFLLKDDRLGVFPISYIKEAENIFGLFNTIANRCAEGEGIVLETRLTGVWNNIEGEAEWAASADQATLESRGGEADAAFFNLKQLLAPTFVIFDPPVRRRPPVTDRRFARQDLPVLNKVKALNWIRSHVGKIFDHHHATYKRPHNTWDHERQALDSSCTFIDGILRDKYPRLLRHLLGADGDEITLADDEKVSLPRLGMALAVMDRKERMDLLEKLLPPDTEEDFPRYWARGLKLTLNSLAVGRALYEEIPRVEADLIHSRTFATARRHRNDHLDGVLAGTIGRRARYYYGRSIGIRG